MKLTGAKKLSVLLIIFSAAVFAFGQNPDAVPKTENDAEVTINVLEFRNYLLRPNSFERFQNLFDHFIQPMKELGGYTLGTFRLKGDDERFVWMRAYRDMRTRYNFLNAFYYKSPEWKKRGKEANGMMINATNAHLLRPLNLDNRTEGIKLRQFGKEGEVVVADFYVCNGSLDETIALFKKDYLPFLRQSGVDDVSLWVSEMSENDFPALPAFQDKNLLVSITVFRNEREAQSKLKKIDAPNAQLDLAMKQTITVRNRLTLYSTMK